jgi:hypothetical protein
MSALSIEELYERHIKPLTPGERLRLMELTAHDLAQITVVAEEDSNGQTTGLSRFIGAASGSFATPADVDAFIRQERDQ